MDEIRLLRLLADGPRYLAEIERTESCSHVSALSAAINLRRQRLIEFSYLKNSPLSITADGDKLLAKNDVSAAQRVFQDSALVVPESGCGRGMKSWATILWISKNTHWVVARQDDGEGSVFENEESELEIEDRLLANWSAYGGDEEVLSANQNRSFQVYIQGRFPFWGKALEAGKRWSGES